MTGRLFTSIIALGLIGLAAMAPALAQSESGPLRARLAARMAERMKEPPAPGGTGYSYGADALQKLRFWPGRTPDAPLVVFVHGGGWKRGDMDNATGAAKIEHFVAQGYAVASIDYRLVPAATVEQQAADVVTAVAYLRSNAAKLGFNAKRIALMGHSAGAHLVALVGTDPNYLKASGMSEADLRGVILLDGAAYDVSKQIAGRGRFMHDTYIQAFGSEEARQKALSPTLQAARPNAPSFLILHIDRVDGKAQSEALGAALAAVGTQVEVKGFEGAGLRGHMAINRSLGDPAYPATAVVDAWLKKTL